MILTTQLKGTNFVEKYKLPKLTQDKTENLISLVSVKETELKQKIFPKRKHQAQRVLLVNVTIHLKKKKYCQFYTNSFRKQRQKKCFPNSFYEADINLITKSDKANTV